MKSKILAIVILIIGESIFGNTKVWTLEECVRYALENNISILQARNNILSNENNATGDMNQDSYINILDIVILVNIILRN